MSIDNKKINIVSDVNFNDNNITDAKINAQENTISNLEVSNFKSGVIQATVRDTTSALDTAIPTEKAVSEALSNISIEADSYNYEVKTFASQSTSSANDQLVVDTLVNEHSLVFKNGQLLRYSNDYDCGIYASNQNNNYNIISRIWFLNKLENDNITIINGLNARHYTGRTGNILDTGYEPEVNIIVLKNGVLLSGQDSWNFNYENPREIILGTALRKSDLITIIPNYNGRYMLTNGVSGYTITLNGYNIPDNVLVWKNNVMLMLGEDFTIDGSTLTFTTELVNEDFIQISTPKENSIYVALSSKQDKLPILEPGKFLTSDGNNLEWNNINSKDITGIFYPKNNNELIDIINGNNRAVIDFSNYNDSFNPDGYNIINKDYFKLRNLVVDNQNNINYGNFGWFSSSLFIFKNSTIEIENFDFDIHNMDCNNPPDPKPIIEIENDEGNPHSYCITIKTSDIYVYNCRNISKLKIIASKDSKLALNHTCLYLSGSNDNNDECLDRGAIIECNNTEVNYDNKWNTEVLLEFCKIHSWDFNESSKGLEYLEGSPASVIQPSYTTFECVIIEEPWFHSGVLVPNNSEIINAWFSKIGNITTYESQEHFNTWQANTTYHPGDLLDFIDPYGDPENPGSHNYVRVINTFTTQDTVNWDDFISNMYTDQEYGQEPNIVTYYDISIDGTCYDARDPNNRIQIFNSDSVMRLTAVNTETIDVKSDDWNLPIHSDKLRSNNVKNALEELADKSNSDQTDYYNRAEIDSQEGIDGDISIDLDIYLSQITYDRWMEDFIYDGSDWKNSNEDIVDLSSLGITIDGTYDNGAKFSVYSEYLTGKTSFNFSGLISHKSAFLNGQLLLKRDYSIQGNRIVFNDYILKSTDALSFI